MLCWTLKLYPLGFQYANGRMYERWIMHRMRLLYMTRRLDVFLERPDVTFSSVLGKFQFVFIRISKDVLIVSQVLSRLNFIEHSLDRKHRAFSKKLRASKSFGEEKTFSVELSVSFIETFILFTKLYSGDPKIDWLQIPVRWTSNKIQWYGQCSACSTRRHHVPWELQRTGHSSRLVIKRWFINSLIGRILTQFEVFQFSW